MNGHHQQNGVENMMLFEVVKMGKSAMQVMFIMFFPVHLYTLNFSYIKYIPGFSNCFLEFF